MRSGSWGGSSRLGCSGDALPRGCTTEGEARKAQSCAEADARTSAPVEPMPERETDEPRNHDEPPEPDDGRNGSEGTARLRLRPASPHVETSNPLAHSVRVGAAPGARSTGHRAPLASPGRRGSCR
jgi:hypothetical protein